MGARESRFRQGYRSAGRDLRQSTQIVWNRRLRRFHRFFEIAVGLRLGQGFLQLSEDRIVKLSKEICVIREIWGFLSSAVKNKLLHRVSEAFLFVGVAHKVRLGLYLF